MSHVAQVHGVLTREQAAKMEASLASEEQALAAWEAASGEVRRHSSPSFGRTLMRGHARRVRGHA